MGTYYRVFAEAKINGVWTCINGYLPSQKDGRMKLSCVYENASRSYFGNTANKLEELGRRIRYSDMSASMQEKLIAYADSEYAIFVATSFSAVTGSLPHGQEHEYHGFATKDDVFRYESGDMEDLYDAISGKEYSGLGEKARMAYQYYEWDDPMGWFTYLKQIAEHTRWLMKDWEYINDELSDSDVRLITVID